MEIARLVPDRTVLLVIDVQQRLMPTLADGPRCVTNCVALLEMATALELPVVVTEQNPAGLGRTVEDIARAIPATALRVEKSLFSAFVPEVRSTLLGLGRPDVLVCGIEAHVCVLQSVLDLLADGFRAFAVTDAITAGQPDQIAPALRRMESAGAVPTGVVSAMYELMRDARHPAFRRCLGIAKGVDFDRAPRAGA